MIHSPFDSPLFVPTMLRVAVLLVAGALLVAVTERRRCRRLATLWESALCKRVVSWTLMAPAFALGVFSGGAVSCVLMAVLTTQAVREFARLTGLTKSYRLLLLALVPVVLTVAALAPAYLPDLPVAAFLLVSLAAVLRSTVDGAYRQLTVTLFGFMYLPLMLSFFVLIGRHVADGTAVLAMLGMSVALSDICAFVAGSILRGPRLAPRISPNKTVSGAVGNVAGAYLALAVMWFAVPPMWPIALTLALPAIIAVAAIWGDLLESLIKRTFVVKDAGAILPGFGGLLDRIDSLIVAVPLTYIAVRLAG